MSKITNFVFMISGVLLLLAFAGFDTATGNLLDWLGLTVTSSGGQITSLGISSITAVLFVVAIAAVLTVSAATSGSISIGTIGSSITTEKLVAVPANTLLIWGMLDLYSLFDLAKTNFSGDGTSWIIFLVGLVVFPLMLAYGISIIEFWRGSD